MVAYILVVLGAAYTSLILQNAVRIGARLGVMDLPGAEAHKSHVRATPLVGGIAAVPAAALVLFGAAAAQMAGVFSDPGVAASLGTLGVITLMAALVGFADDRVQLGATLRLMICALFFLLAVMIRPDFVISTLNIDIVAVQIELGPFAVPFTVFCMLAFQNAVNMADGRNGLVPGIVVIWTLAFLSYGSHPTAPALLSLFIGMILVLALNWRGKVFLGDAGSYGIGALLALVAVWQHRTQPDLHSTGVVAILLIPVLDMARLFVARLVRGRHPFSADKTHLHHLIERAWGWPRGAWIYFALVAAPIGLLRTGLCTGIEAVGFGLGLYGVVMLAAVLTARSALPALTLRNTAWSEVN